MMVCSVLWCIVVYGCESLSVVVFCSVMWCIETECIALRCCVAYYDVSFRIAVYPGVF